PATPTPPRPCGAAPARDAPAAGRSLPAGGSAPPPTPPPSAPPRPPRPAPPRTPPWPWWSPRPGDRAGGAAPGPSRHRRALPHRPRTAYRARLPAHSWRRRQRPYRLPHREGYAKGRSTVTLHELVFARKPKVPPRWGARTER